MFKNVVVLDDSPSDLAVFRHFLKDLPCSVRMFEGPEALRNYKDNGDRPDLIISDLYFNGRRYTEDLVKLAKKLGAKLVIYTGSPKEADKAELLEAGADEYVVKQLALHEQGETILRLLQQEEVPA